MGSLVAELAEKLSSATNNFDIDEGTIYVNTSADTVAIGELHQKFNSCVVHINLYMELFVFLF